MRARLSLADHALPLVAAALLALVVGACDYMVAVPTPRPSRVVAIPEPLPSAEPDESDEAPTLRPDPSGRAGPDLVDAANALADLDSYRVSVATRGLVPAAAPGGEATMTSILIQGEHPAADITIGGVDGYSGGRLRAIVIGDEAWLREGGGSWQKSPGGAADFDAAFTTLSPAGLVAGFEGLSPALRRSGTELRSGIRTIRYHADAGDALAAAAGLGDGSLDAWFAASGGYLVRLDIDGTWDLDGSPTKVQLTIDVTRVNDLANRVAPPAG
jgi:hypothetical protein